MCSIEMAAAAALVGGGTYMQSQAASDAADAQQDALNAQLEQQDRYNRQAEAKAMENAQEYAPEKRAERFEEAQQKAGDSLVQSLVKGKEQFGSPDQAEGRVSETFESDRATKLADQFQKSVDMARLMGKMRGTSDMLGNEAITNADYSSQLGTIGRNAKGAYDAAQPGIIAAGRVDPWKTGLGSMMSAAGTSMAAGGLGKAFSSGGAGTLGSGTFGMDSVWGGTPAAGGNLMASTGGTGIGFNLGSGIPFM
jgi:hypothetical protein